MLKNWAPPLVGLLFSLGYALSLPMFSAFDEPAHFSYILSLRYDNGRPQHPGSFFHRQVEEAMALIPAPVHQLAPWKNQNGGYSYVEWAQLSPEQQRSKTAALQQLRFKGWEEGKIFGNWQAQHPPLYYGIVAFALQASGIDNLTRAFWFCRLLSALIFSSTFFILHYYLVRRWGHGSAVMWWVVFLPMLYVMGSRIANDTLAIPLLSTFLLFLIDALKQEVRRWRSTSWILASVILALGLGSKAYTLSLFPVLGLLFLWVNRKGWQSRSLFLLLPVLMSFLLWGWWLYENYQRTGSPTGMNELVDLKQRNLLGLGTKLRWIYELHNTFLKDTLVIWAGVVTHYFFISNWFAGTAHPVFYVLQLGVFVVPLVILVRRVGKKLFTTPAVLVALCAHLCFFYGLFSFLVNYSLYAGKPIWIGGWYLWSISAALLAVYALAFAQLERHHQKAIRAIIATQVLCFFLAQIANFQFWSGRFDRHPTLKYPVPVRSLLSGS